MLMRVALTEPEGRICTWVGNQRAAFRIAHGLNNGAGRRALEEREILGAHGEYATSIGVNLYWRPTIGDRRGVDVGGLVEVRATDLVNGRLVVKPDDKDYPFVLAIGDTRRRMFDIVGWMDAAQAKANYPLTQGQFDPCHYVPQDDLRPMEELLVLIHRAPPANDNEPQRWRLRI